MKLTVVALVCGACGGGGADGSTGPGATSQPAKAPTSTETAPRRSATSRPATPRTAAPTTGTSVPAPTAPIPRFTFDVSRIDVALADRLSTSWRPGCPVPLARLRYLRVGYHGFAGPPRIGELVVNAEVVEEVREVFAALWKAGYPVASMRLVDDFDGDDLASVRANNTSAFNCRRVIDSGGWSDHAYGMAIDVNPLWNPYVVGGAAIPPESQGWVDRSARQPGMIRDGDAAVVAFEAAGWTWGGRWNSPDYQHFTRRG